jgi:hypothetical protein
MFVSSRAVKFLTILSTLAVTAIQPTFASDDAILHHDNRRLTIASDESIADQIQAARANDVSVNIFGSNQQKPKYKLHAEQAWDAGDFYINVKEATPAITSATTTSTNGGPSQLVSENYMATLLVADTDSPEEKDTIGIIAVDKKTGNVSGIVKKGNGEDVNFFQEKGNKVRSLSICSCNCICFLL